MTKDQVKELLDLVLTWPEDDQEKLAQFVREVEQLRAGDDITVEEWRIIAQRAARRDLATDEEVEKLFSRYRNLLSCDINAAQSQISMKFFRT
jgi:hypothetical protein